MGQGGGRAEPRISRVHFMSGSGRRDSTAKDKQGSLYEWVREERESRAKDKQGSLDEWVREEGEQSQG